MVGRNWRVGNWCDFVLVVALLHRGLLLVLLAEAPTTTTTTTTKEKISHPIAMSLSLKAPMVTAEGEPMGVMEGRRRRRKVHIRPLRSRKIPVL